MDNFFEVLTGLGFWTAAWIWLIEPGIEYWLLSRRSDRAGNLLEAGLRLAAGAICLWIGAFWLVRGIGFGRFLALVLGAACLVGAWWVLRHYRRNWRQLANAQGTRRREVFAHLAAIPALTILGVLVLAYGLF